jgi:hypothetical protein
MVVHQASKIAGGTNVNREKIDSIAGRLREKQPLQTSC